MGLSFLGAPVDRVHLELTNRCALACSKCSRTGSELVKRAGDFPVELVPKLFEGTEIKLATICGNYGDGIYHPQFHGILEAIKSFGVTVDLTTNGSKRSRAWWEKTAEILEPQDRITFSIDGLQDTNHLYRRGSDWESIMTAIESVVGHCRTRWKMIVFRHNEHQIEEAQKLAQSLGLDEFRINKSARFRVGKEDPLRPLKPEWVGLRSRNQNVIKGLLKAQDRDGLGARVRVKPQCETGRELFVDFAARVFPCCACAMFETSPYAEHFRNPGVDNDLHTNSLDTILQSDCWDSLASTWDSPVRAPASCVKRCGVTKALGDELMPDEFMAKPSADNLRIKF